MPNIDFPLEELHRYQGINPKPLDFDSYWDESISEMKGIDPQVDLTPTREIISRNIDCFHLYFTGVNGARVHAHFLKPKKISGKLPAIVQFHGYTGNRGDWFEKLAWANEGFIVASMDCRGQGGQSEDSSQLLGNTYQGHIIRGLDDPNPKKLLFRQIFLDTAQLAGILMAMSEVDSTRVASVGGSQGGALAIACAALEPRIYRTVSTFPFLSDYQRTWKMDLCKDAYAELLTYFRLFDPIHERETEIFTKLGYIDIQHLAPRIQAEVLMSVGLMDSICPPSTQFAMYNKIKSSKSLRIYPDFGHEGLPKDRDAVFAFLTKE